MFEFPALIRSFSPGSGGYCRSMLPKSSRRASAPMVVIGLRGDAAMTSLI